MVSPRISLWLVALLALVCMNHGLQTPAMAVESMTGQPVVVMATPGNAFTRVPPPAQFTAMRGRVKGCTINVTYHGFTPTAQTAFQYAVDIWETLVTSPVTINVDATWTALGPGILGSCGPSTWKRNFVGAPRNDNWYPSALANALHGSDLDAGTNDMNASFSSVFTWYLGTDGNCPASQYDLVTVVLHELGHGLGFLGTGSYNTGTSQGSWGWASGGTTYPAQYDRLVMNGSGYFLLDTTRYANPSVTLGAQITSNNLFCNGANAIAANGGSRPKYFVPATWNGGSSYAHWDETTYPAGNPNSLMTPAFGAAESIHTPGAITLGLFKDLGWTIATYAPKPDLWIRNDTDASYLGDNVNNLTGVGQSKSQYASAGSTATYYFRIQNDNTASDTFRVTGSAGDANWTVHYYNMNTSTEITSDITSLSGWYSPSQIPGSTTTWIRAEVTPAAGLTGNTAKTISLTAMSEGNTTAKDVVTATTTVFIAQPDALIKTASVFPFITFYIGNNIYNPDGTNQTCTWMVRANTTATFYIQVQNDGNDTDTFTVSGYIGSPTYHVHYYDYATNAEITAAIGNGTWSTGSLPAGSAKTIYVTLTPDATTTFGTTQNLHIVATSQRNASKQDKVIAAVPLITDRPDIQVRNSGETRYSGNNVYNLTASGQTSAQIIAKNTTATYQLLLQNDGNAYDSYSVTAWASYVAWHARYYDATNTDITSAITSSQGWGVGLNVGATTVITLTVSPDNTVLDGAAQTLNVTMTSAYSPLKQDLACAITTTQKRRPDLIIGNATDLIYVGDNVYNLDAVGQSRQQSINNNTTAFYYVRIQNDGNVPDMLVIRGDAGVPAYQVNYYWGFTNVTASVINEGLWLGPLMPGGYTQITVSMTPTSDVIGGTCQNLLIWATSASVPALTDVVQATTQVSVSRIADLQVRNYGEAGFCGNDIYNGDATGQRKEQYTDANLAVKFFFKLQNDGNVTDTYRITCPAVPVGWSVQYVESSGSVDITAAVNGPGWLSGPIAPGMSKNYYVRIVPSSILGLGASLELPLIAFSVQADNVRDVNKTLTTLKVYQPDLLIRRNTDNNFIGNGVYNTNGISQTLTQILTSARSATYYLRIHNDGNLPDSFNITGTASNSDWTVQYFTVVGNHDITMQVTAPSGINTIVLPPDGTTSVALYVVVTANPGIAVGSNLPVKIVAKSNTIATKVDAVKAVTSVP